MTQVWYGGKPDHADLGEGAIELEIVRTVRYHRKPVYDGPTLLYHEVDYECEAVYNPMATAYYQDGVGGFAVQDKGLPGQLAVNTDLAIRHKLMEPRRKLVIAVGGQSSLVSPLSGFICDAANGPFPYLCDIVQIPGDKTFFIRWGVRTFVNACYTEKKEPELLLSHRWSQQRSVDVDSMSTLVTRGHAFLDVGSMKKKGVIPDQAWEFLCHPLPAGFRRESVDVVATEDGDQLQYTIVDVEQPFVLALRGVTRVEAKYNGSINRGDAVMAGISVAQKAARMVADSTRTAGLRGSTFKGTAVYLLDKGWKATPRHSHEVDVHVWGSRLSNRNTLMEHARITVRRIISSLDLPALDTAFADFATHVEHDIMGKYVRAHISFETPQVGNLLRIFDGIDFANGPKKEVIAGLTQVNNDVAVNAGLVGGKDGTGKGNRGSWVGTVAAQHLSRACEPQAYPDIPRLLGRDGKRIF